MAKESRRLPWHSAALHCTSTVLNLAIVMISVPILTESRTRQGEELSSLCRHHSEFCCAILSLAICSFIDRFIRMA